MLAVTHLGTLLEFFGFESDPTDISSKATDSMCRFEICRLRVLYRPFDPIGYEPFRSGRSLRS